MPQQRRVRRLHLSGPDEAALHRAGNLLEDALRTASLPGDDSRVVIVRRLVLPALSSGASAQTLSRVLEDAVRHGHFTWMHGAEDHASQADVVWFEHALEAHSCAAVQLVRGRALLAWYWPSILAPALAGSPLTLRTLALSLAELPEAPVALRLWLATVDAEGGLAQLLATLGNVDRTRLGQAAQMEWPSNPPIAEIPRSHEPPTVTPIAVTLTPRTVPSDQAANRVANRASTDLPTPSAPESPATGLVVDVTAARMRADVMPRMTPWRRDAAPEARVDTVPAPAAMPSADMPEGVRATGQDDDGSQPWFAPTVAGGIAFLLPVLQRLGYPQWLDDHPEWEDANVARRVIADVLRALDVPVDDPAWALACDGFGRRTVHSDIDARVYERWPTVAVPAAWSSLYRCGNRFLAGPGLDGAVTAWRTACRRWLRQVPCIGMVSLVLREGGVRCSNTHVEFCFDLDAADLRLRRHELDYDPGWLPWLGRVVQFHFLANGGRHGTP